MTAVLDATMARWAEAKVAEGVAQGIEQGRMEMFGRFVALRFGAGVAAQATTLLADVAGGLPFDASKWLLECERRRRWWAACGQPRRPRATARLTDGPPRAEAATG